MANCCPKCSMQYGMSSRVEKDAESGEFVCRAKKEHRYSIDSSGMLHPAKNAE